MTLKEIVLLKNKVINNKMHYSKAWDIIEGSSTKPWQTKEWKEKRKKIIKDYCEQCGADDKIMVLQHLKQPVKNYSLRRHIAGVLFLDYCKKNKVEIDISKKEVDHFINKDVIQRSACPKCDRFSIHERKNLKPKYRCFKPGCYYEFEKPKSLIYFPKYKIGFRNYKDIVDFSIEKISDDFYRNKMKDFCDQNDELIGKTALVESIKQHEEYMLMKYTQTWCKKCAFLYDKKGMLLCPNCKIEYYSHLHYRYCYNCNMKIKLE